jgi:hypothetical protein
MPLPETRLVDQSIPGLEWLSIGHMDDEPGMTILTFRDQDKNEFRVAVSDQSIEQLSATFINAAGRAFAAKARATTTPALVPKGAINITATGLGIAIEPDGPMLMIRSGGVDLFISVDKELLVDTCQRVVDQADQLPETKSPGKKN